MTDDQKKWIDNATYEELLRKWRFEPIGSSWFVSDTGTYFSLVFSRKKAELTEAERVAASKRVGWG